MEEGSVGEYCTEGFVNKKRNEKLRSKLAELGEEIVNWDCLGGCMNKQGTKK